MSDIVERLRSLASNDDLWRKEHIEAATEIEALRRENQRLRIERDEWKALATEFKGLTEEWQARAEQLDRPRIKPADRREG